VTAVVIVIFFSSLLSLQLKWAKRLSSMHIAHLSGDLSSAILPNHRNHSLCSSYNQSINQIY